MKIIRIDKADYELVVALFNDYRIFYKQPSDMDLARAFLLQRLENNESIIFVAMDSTAAVGFTQLYPKFSSMRATRNWVLNDLFVDPKFRKKGIGEKLIQEAIEFARLDGATFVDLSTAVDNLTAQSLYEQIGFTRKGNDSEFYDYRIAVSKTQ
ncbi:GNAT family N-acetyltransferase [Sphingobacterium corticibacter]|uniref:GNAT family N-acetyltransferase n=1 Tax=Sphingobacterium corticibacter TaxID=2171749 RepID=A0A2T8HMQ6_9SPHI|nr:GNAT family N-acetyltransferase [Sphingobacterium corticibacter]PVH26724.1 GNAT family N-acetyltransferase [Sphingobacterium corticibacter]